MLNLIKRLFGRRAPAVEPDWAGGKLVEVHGTFRIQLPASATYEFDHSDNTLMVDCHLSIPCSLLFVALWRFRKRDNQDREVAIDQILRESVVEVLPTIVKKPIVEWKHFPIREDGLIGNQAVVPLDGASKENPGGRFWLFRMIIVNERWYCFMHWNGPLPAMTDIVLPIMDSFDLIDRNALGE